MDTELEKKIEQLEQQRECDAHTLPVSGKEVSAQIDELAKESRNKSMDKAEYAKQ